MFFVFLSVKVSFREIAKFTELILNITKFKVIKVFNLFCSEFYVSF